MQEIDQVAAAGTLHDPITNPQSEFGKMINDIAGGLNEFGSWLGIETYDFFHWSMKAAGHPAAFIGIFQVSMRRFFKGESVFRFSLFG